MKRKAKIIVAILAVLFVLSACGGNDAPEPEITMYSNDNVGATRHTIVGWDDYEPSGKYKVVCTEGHGEIHINDSERFLFAADDKKGTEFGDTQVFYEESLEIELMGNDEIMARSHNSSEFKLEFYIVE